MKLASESPALGEKLHPMYEFLAAEVVWACRNEMVAKVEDFLARRVRFLLLDAKASLEAAPKVASLMAQELGKNEAWIAKEIEDYTTLVKNYTL